MSDVFKNKDDGGIQNILNDYTPSTIMYKRVPLINNYQDLIKPYGVIQENTSTNA